MKQEFILNPYLTIRVDSLDSNGINITAGRGSHRSEIIFDEPDVVAWLFNFREPKSFEQAIALAQQSLGVHSDDAENLVKEFIENSLLLESNQNYLLESARVWENFGWRDAFDFHYATGNLVFDPDYEKYNEAMKDYFDRVEDGTDDPQPGPYKKVTGLGTVQLIDSRSHINSISLGQVLRQYSPADQFINHPVTFAQLSEMLHSVYGVQFIIDTPLGPHLAKTSPSGGARHPIEAYVVANSVIGLPKGLYYYSPEDNELKLLRAGDFADEVGSICYEKTAIKTAPVVIFLTSRWARHIWKYRYSRSYRMVLFDSGHLLQTQVLVCSALGLQTFFCPSVHDTNSLKFLGLESDCDEGVLFTIGIGVSSHL